MRNLFKILSVFTISLLVFNSDSFSAKLKKTKGQSAIQHSTKVRAKVETKGLFSEECYNLYYGCMDQFCSMDNVDGGTCSCSDKNKEYEEKLTKIDAQLKEANKLATVEVERIEAGSKADIIFNGERKYDEKGNVIKSEQVNAEQKKKDEEEARRQKLLAMFETSDEDGEEYEDSEEEILNIANKKGDELYKFANNMCKEQVQEKCSNDLKFLIQMYSGQITSDCKAMEYTVNQKQEKADKLLAEAEKEVRGALKKSFEEANKFDRGQCMVEFKKCMQKDDACGNGWEKCVFTVASENMQNDKVSGDISLSSVEMIEKYEISKSTYEILDSKRYICENILDQCMANRQYVWDDFLREAAPTIKLAESEVESNKRQSCLKDISNCIQKACKDDIVGKGKDTMDSCLARPDMARSFCKVQIDPCERMEPQIWSYVVDKLAAMRVDACTQEVKDCFTSDDRCGKDFSRCIGMDYNFIKNICPIDKLVVCKKANPNFSINDLDKMLIGLYMNIDNSALSVCQKKVDEKMIELCGSTTDCDKFTVDDTIGTGSLNSVKKDNMYYITGLITFGAIKMGSISYINDSGKIEDENGNKILQPGELDISEYIAEVKKNNDATYNNEEYEAKSINKGQIISTIEAELENIVKTSNRTIQIMESDPDISACVHGRNLKQITGKAEMTEARFPNLLNKVKGLIAMNVLRKAQDNYNKKLEKMISDATKEASLEIAQYMCNKMTQGGGNTNKINGTDPYKQLTPAYGIVYEVGNGMKLEDIAGRGEKNNYPLTSSKEIFPGIYVKKNGHVEEETTSTFDRDSRVCEICTRTIIEHCENQLKEKGNWFTSDLYDEVCNPSEPKTTCKKIGM